MNRLSDPNPADTLSGAALSPCPVGTVSEPSSLGRGVASASAGSESAPPLDAPADLPLVSLQRTLADFAVISAAITAALAAPHFRRPQPPVENCHFLDHLREQAEIARSHATALVQITDILWNQSAAECAKRYKAIDAEVERKGAVEHFDPREPEPFREPDPCPQCGGHGGSVSEGSCDVCEGTGIDPRDPLSPL